MVFRSSQLKPAPAWLYGATSLWALLLLVGVGLLTSYSKQPGAVYATSDEWPADSGLGTPDEMTLLMAVHPRCPCTRSSVSELSRLIRVSEGRVNCVALIYFPEGAAEAWGDSDIQQSIALIPGVRIHADVEGEEAKRHGMLTSGAVVLYDRHGTRLFTGGVTSARGHEGRSVGQASILALMGGETPGQCCTPVYGCSLKTPGSRESP